jgi:hypothetical protein
MGKSVPITLTFTPTTPILSGGTITLNYPSGFFLPNTTPSVDLSASSVAAVSFSFGVTTATSVVITTSGATIGLSAFVVTIRGFKMGTSTAGSTAGITLQTSVDMAASTACPSGVIFPTLAMSFLPVTGGLIAYYTADSWTGSQWTDLSGAGNHVTEIGGGGFAVAQSDGIPAYLHGSSTSWMIFPESILPSADYTLFYVARYNGPKKERIFTGFNINWLSGFWGSKSGVKFCRDTWVTPANDVHGMNWVVGADRCNSYRSNRVERGSSYMCTAFDRLAINAGPQGNFEKSDFAIQYVLVYSVKLSDADVQIMEAFLSRTSLYNISFGISHNDRVAHKSYASVTLAFNPTTPIPVGGNITVTYPSRFFAPSVTPSLLAGSSSVSELTGACSPTTDTSLLIMTGGAVIPASYFTVTITGFMMGAITAGSVAVTVQTSTDTLAYFVLDSGYILGENASFVTSPSFSISSSDRIARKSGVSVTVGFTPTKPISDGGTITVKYPHSFFASNVTPTMSPGASTILNLTATFGSSTASSFVITIAGASIPSYAFTLTIQGLTIGAQTSGEVAVTIESSSDTVPSAAVSSGQIFGQLAYLSFTMRFQDRIAMKSSVSVTLSFITSVMLPPRSSITLNYPSGFFAPSIIPIVPFYASSAVGVSISCSATTATSIVLKTSGTTIVPSAFSLTISGLIMGARTAGAVGISAQTSLETVASFPVDSGPILAAPRDANIYIEESFLVSGLTNVNIILSCFVMVDVWNPVVTLHYPEGYFVPGIYPKFELSALDSRTSPTRSSSFQFTLTGGWGGNGWFYAHNYHLNGRIIEKIMGLVMGQPTSRNASGFRIEVSSHDARSDSFLSPGIVTAASITEFVPKNVFINSSISNNFTLSVVGTNFSAESCTAYICANPNCALSINLPSMVWYLNAAVFEASPSRNWPDLSGFGSSSVFHNQHTNWGDDFHNYPIHSSPNSRTPYFDFNPSPFYMKQVVCRGETYAFTYGSNDAFSIGIWFSTKIASGLTIIGLQDGCTDNSNRYDLKFLIGFDGKLYFGASCAMLGTSFSVTDGVWRYAVATYSKSSIKLYVDGVLIGSSAPNVCSNAWDSLFNGVWILAGIRTTGWGSNFDGYGGYWPGKIGLVHIHNISLSQTQVEASWMKIQDQMKQANSCRQVSSSVVEINMNSSVQNQNRVRLEFVGGSQTTSSILFDINCAAGFLQNILPHSQQCLSCPSGFFCNSSGISHPSGICLPGSFSTEASMSCKLCPAGKYCDSAGLSYPSGECTAGSFSNDGEQSCTPCDKGLYQPQEGKGLCLQCPAGMYCNASGLRLPSGTCYPG